MISSWLLRLRALAVVSRRRSFFRPRCASIRHSRLLVELLEERRLLTAIGNPAWNTPEALSPVTVDPAHYRSSSLIVQFKPGASTFSSSSAASLGGALGSPWSIAPGLREVELASGTDVQAAAAAYASDPNVLFAEPDYRVQLNLAPDDPSFGNQWDFDNTAQTGGQADADIDAPEAWDVTTGSHSTIVAIIDTGVDYTHPDLAPNMWTNPGEIAGNGLDDDHNGYIDDIHGYDFANNDGDPMDDHFHGTHVAGTIGAAGNDGFGIAGVNWHVQIMALKFLDASGGGYTSDAIAALNYAVANGAKVSNNSWGGGGFSQAFQTALQNAAAKGHIFVAAAGNDSNNNDANPFYPANYKVDNIVSVAATDNSDNLAYFSNYGKQTVDLAAPGVDIYSTLPTHVTQAMQDEGLGADFGTLSGTSMATPHVTGVIALVQSLHPDWSADQVIQQVLGTVDVVPGGLNTISGGRLNAAGAVGNPPPDTSNPRIVGSDPPGSTTSAVDHVRIQFSESIDPASFTLGDETTPSDVLSFTGPAGPIPVLAIVPVAGNKRQFDVAFAKQSAEGKYTLVIGPHIRDLAGNELDQNRNGTPGEEPGDQYTASFSIVGALVFSSDDVPAPVRGFTALASYLTIDEDVAISDLNVQLNVSYSQVGSLMLLLVAPSGDYATLSLFNGDGADFQDTTFDDEAPTPIAAGSAPFAGSFQPDEPLSIFDGQSSAGTWTLWVENWAFGGSRGTLSAWSLAISADGAGPPPGSDNQPPLPGDDAFATDLDAPLVVSPDDLLANDIDPDGDALAIISVGNPTGGTVDVDEDGMIVFTPDAQYSGPAGFQYVVSDGTDTALGTVAINIQPLFAWHNNVNGLDVDNDGIVAPVDAVLVINVLNASGGGSLEHTTALAGDRPYYYDVAADNYVSPLDALTIINYLNAQNARSMQAAEATGVATNLTAAADASAPLGALPAAAAGSSLKAPAGGLSGDVPLAPTPTARPRHPASPPHALGGSPRAVPPFAPRKEHRLDPSAVDRALLDLDLSPPHRQPSAPASARRGSA